MVNTFNKVIIKDVFNAKYDEKKFKSFVADLLNGADFAKEQMLQPIPNDYKDFIRSAKRLCKYTYSTNDYDETTIDVLVVKLKKASSIDRARTAQRNFIARYLNGGRNYQKDAALVVFLSEDENENISDDWRLSLVKMDYKRVAVTDENGNIKKVKTEVELTPAKRFSFLVEKNGTYYNTHTVQSRFSTLLEKSTNGAKLTIEDLVQAFDIEKVSKEFFDEYKKLYGKMCDELKRLCSVDKEIKKDFEDNKIIIEDFAKKTMGQLVFLYFIQKKGWLGVEQGKDWGTGDKNFMRNIFDKVYCEYDNFFNDVLEYLFYEALAKKRTDKNDIFEFPNSKKTCRIPFLNGGLFEPINNYKYEVTNITIDNNIFKEIFDTFDLYNFTVKEDEPLEKEVAVDPEMLGKVFENLLPENIRKGNGAFYTPREIVHYMCQESLINYLYNKVNTKTVELSPQQKAEQQKLFKNKKIEQLVFMEEIFEEKFSKEDISVLIKKGDSAYKNKNKKVDTELPKIIIDNSNELDNALANIKVCDPAIGSGAFPVGMMNEIVRARSVLSPEKSIYDLKRNAIENSIYGVDLDGGAVEIAKLRFWLSLVVDEENTKTISPLPNLDYKIMQGNSLITSYESIDFDEIVEEYKPNTQLMINLWGDKSQDLKQELKSLMDNFFAVSNPEDKKNLKEQIENKIVELVKNKFEEKAKREGKSEDFYEKDIRNFAKNKENRNFFPWKLFFGDAFEKGGFDIVIGNPPYVSTKGVSTDDKKEYEKEFGFSDDTYNLFFFKGYSILNNCGVLTYITPKTFWTTQTKRNLRDLLLSQKIDFIFDTANPFDAAMVDTCVTSINNIVHCLNIQAREYIRNLINNNRYSDAVAEIQKYSKNILEKHQIKFLDGTSSITKPELYNVSQKIYLNTQNSVIFKPTERNILISNLYGEKVKKLYDTWWNKIETSKKIAQNRNELEKYRNSLKPGDIALLGCLTEGGQGLATANNGKYIAVRKSTKWAKNIISSRPKKLEDAISKYKIPLSQIDNLSVQEFFKQKNEKDIVATFDKLKETYGRDIFGQGYIYRLIDDSELADVDSLSVDEKENGIDVTKKYYVPYDKGDKDGNRWYLETPFAIAWSKENVQFLKTNSGKKGAGMPVVRNPQFNFREGICWNDINTTYLKCRLKQKSINDVKSMSLYGICDLVPEYYIISLINSTFISKFVDDFINNTQTFQINDARMLPIVILDKTALKNIKNIFDRAVLLKKETFKNPDIKIKNDIELEQLQIQLDLIVERIYNLKY